MLAADRPAGPRASVAGSRAVAHADPFGADHRRHLSSPQWWSGSSVWHLDPVAALLIYGAAVVAASFLLAWAAEAAQIDVSGGLAIAALALVAVLPEYAVDLYYAYVSGHEPDYTQYAAANMTGSNRLLMGLGWPVVVLVGIVVARKPAPTKYRLAWRWSPPIGSNSGSC